MSSAADAIARTIAQVQSEPRDAAHQCFSCQRRLWVSFFFDEPGQDAERESDPGKLSNLGKMYRAHSDINENGIYPLYYNGLGVDFRQPDVARRQTAEQTGRNAAGDAIKDEARDAAGDVVLGKGKEALKDLKNPKHWLGMIPGILARISIEAWGWVRDNPLVSRITLSGVDTRVNNALARLDEIVAQQDLPVTRINVAVFGSGMGGAIARLFINRLLARCEHRGSIYYPSAYKNTTLEIHFLGLFDCISSTVNNFLAGEIAGKASLGLATLRVEGPMGIPEAVHRAVHLVAGHELRATRRVDSLRRGKAQFPSEQVLPGNHDDLTGIAPEGHQGRSSQLARAALQRLHREAYVSGVPIRSMEILEVENNDLFDAMQITYAVKIRPDSPLIPLDRLLMQYPKTSGKLEEQLLEHTRCLVSWMRLRLDTPAAPGRPPQAAYDLVGQHIHRLSVQVNHPRSTYRLSHVERVLLETWKTPTTLHPAAMALFDVFVHDELYRSLTDRMAADLSNNGYFKLRGIDESNEFN